MARSGFKLLQARLDLLPYLWGHEFAVVLIVSDEVYIALTDADDSCFAVIELVLHGRLHGFV